jgi:hypothetical protein
LVLLNAHRAAAALDELPSGRDRGALESPIRPIVWKIGAAGAKPISPQAKFLHSAAERGPKSWQLIKLVRNRTKALAEFPI